MTVENMRTYFYELADDISGLIRKYEVFLCWFQGEESDFVRLNQAKIRQAGNVSQCCLGITLISGKRQVHHNLSIMKDARDDRAMIQNVITELREKLKHVPEDPYLLYAAEPYSSERKQENRLSDTGEVTGEIIKSAAQGDLVGIYTAGTMAFGFANSFGQRNWFESYSYNFDWCLYHKDDKAVKTGFSGTEWNSAEFQKKTELALQQLDILSGQSRTIAPGKYRVYLAPTALYNFMEMLGFRAFGLKNHRTKNTSLIKMAEDNKTLHASVSMSENTAGGVAPDFTPEGFIKPGMVHMIEAGKYKDCLACPRSGKEYNTDHNAANIHEFPESFEMAPGQISGDDVIRILDNGIYINNVWYLNYSDVTGCRITGMTRFACFLVENGKIAAPINVMRFDETVYRMLGENLVGLTQDRDFMISAETYNSRSSESYRLPGALVENFTFTL
ncbi:MAG: TldE/PmbA family protein [Desulfobacterales bacterium]|nr:TldE/PmbA family protein [Desulfobacterales bacterium]